MALIAFAVMSGVLQMAGYIFYALKTRRPNPLSWLMWAYGTTLVGFLEYDYGASWYILLLPIVCSVSSIVIAIRCWKNRDLSDLDWSDWSALGADVILTIGYVFAKYLEHNEMLTKEGQETSAFAFIILSNATTFTTFWPTIRGIWHDPSRENWWSWRAWTLAYTALAITTALQYGFLSIFMVYPVLNMAVHAAMALAVRPSRHTLA